MGQYPIGTDMTQQQILKAINNLTAVMQGWRNAAVENDIYFVPIVTEATTKDEAGNVTKVTCALSGVTFDQLLSAYNSGKTIFAKLLDTSGTVYYMPLDAAVFTAASEIFRFESVGTQNPAARPSFVQLLRMTSNGNVFVTYAFNRINAVNVSCDVTIGGVQYTDIASVLNALTSA